MDVRISNGTVVTRIYGKSREGEFLAAFQYLSDAEAFALAQLDKDRASMQCGSLYIVSDTGTGRVTFYCQENDEKPRVAK
jgi:hypothetical protein